MAAIKIWGAETPRSFRPIWMAEELGIDYEHLPIGPRTGETQTEEYTRMNRKQKIPFLVDESADLRISESVAICRYLRNAYPGPNVFVPDTLAHAAKEDEWVCYVYGELDETGLYVMRRHTDLAAIYGTSEEVVASTKGYLQRHMNVLEAHLAGREHLMDQGFGLADLLLVSCLDWASFYGVELPPEVARYRDHNAQRPAYEKAMQVNYVELLGGTRNGTA